MATGFTQYAYPFFTVEADRIEAEDARTDEWLRVRAIVSGLFFTSAMIGKWISYIEASVIPAMSAAFLSALTISLFPFLPAWMPSLFGSG